MPNQSHLSRRELIQIGALATGVAAAGAERVFASDYAPKVFSPEELAMLDELAELIIPADDHSPGARAAGVAAFLDGRLSASIEEAERTEWREGLKRIDALAHELRGVPFMQATPEQRVAVLSHIAKNEKNPQTPGERFFVQLKFSTADAYYSSKIGIHQEMEYKGNVLLQEFAGYEVE
jgi:glucoside 3-dehydrogenase (cytochrome c) hitch-hiker subunit